MKIFKFLSNALFVTQLATLATTLSLGAFFQTAQAADQIFHQYQSVRDMGMGGCKITTGLYDDNFFANPARATANPAWRLTLFDPSLEVDNHLVSNVKSFTGSGDTVQRVADTAGQNNHARLQTTMPAWYLPPSDHRRWAMGVALISSSQFDMDLRQNYSVDTDAFIDIGPAVTYAYEFLDDRSLSVGATGHLIYRLSTDQPYTIGDLLRGRSFQVSSIGSQGTSVDFDLGTTKKFNWHPHGIELSAGLAIDNVLGGKYNGHIVNPVANLTNRPPDANRSFGLGVSAKRDIGYFFKDVLVAVESSDNGNNTNGSFYRTLHAGVEARILHILVPRVGVNQGYFTAGLGIDLKIIEIEAATYGEELGLNAGEIQDRRYGIHVSIHL